ncbi:MAG: diacylglycerol/polyprenol kinase family protein, partial [Nitrososphaerales archaeon]
VGDGSASIVGRMYGKNKIPFSNGKTIEGTATGIICAFVGASLFISPTMAITAALIGMIVEFLPLRVNDNITVPLLAALSMTLMQMLEVGTG